MATNCVRSFTKLGSNGFRAYGPSIPNACTFSTKPPFTSIRTESSVHSIDASKSDGRFCASVASTERGSGAIHFWWPSVGKPFTKNTSSASSQSVIAVPLPTDPPFTTSTTLRKQCCSTISLIEDNACATRLLKLLVHVLVLLDLLRRRARARARTPALRRLLLPPRRSLRRPRPRHAQRTALHLRLLLLLELLQRHHVIADESKLGLLPHDEVERPHLHDVRNRHVELLDELAAQRRHLHRRSVLLQDLLELVRHRQRLQARVVAHHRDLAALEHELLPGLDELRELHLDADRLERLVGAHAVLVAVQQAQLVGREVARLEQLLELRRDAVLRCLQYELHRARFRDTAIAQRLLLIQLLAAAHQLVLRERDQLRSCHLLLHTPHRLSRGHRHLNLRRRRTLLHRLHTNLNLHRYVFELRSRSCTKEVHKELQEQAARNRLEPKWLRP